MAILLKLGIGLVIAFIVYMGTGNDLNELPEDLSSVVSKINDVKDDLIDNSIEGDTNHSENEKTPESRLYLGKPTKSIEFPCTENSDCVDSICDTENGECYILE